MWQNTALWIGPALYSGVWPVGRCAHNLQNTKHTWTQNSRTHNSAFCLFDCSNSSEDKWFNRVSFWGFVVQSLLWLSQVHASRNLASTSCLHACNTNFCAGSSMLHAPGRDQHCWTALQLQYVHGMHALCKQTVCLSHWVVAEITMRSLQ